MTADLEMVLTEEKFQDHMGLVLLGYEEDEEAIYAHDAALRALLREALDGWWESEEPAGAPGWSWNKDGQLFNETHKRISKIRRAVFGEEKK